jgi:hypothetical protein
MRLLAAFCLLSTLAVTQTVKSVPACEIEQVRAEGDRKAASEFVMRLRSLIQGDKRAEIAQVISFPLRVSGKGRVANKEQFLKHYDRIFDSTVRQSVLTQDENCLFGNWQGFMTGNGSIWFDADETGKVKIHAINSPSWNLDKKAK